MTPRDANLLPRLLQVLDTIENEAEIVQAVLQVRRILKNDRSSLTKLAENLSGTNAKTQVSMAEDRHEIAVRLRDLGLMLRFAAHPDRAIEAAFRRASTAMAQGTSVAGEDLRVCLACLRDLLKAKMRVDRDPLMGQPPMSYTTTQSPWFDQAARPGGPGMTEHAARRASMTEDMIRRMSDKLSDELMATMSGTASRMYRGGGRGT